MKLQHFSFLTSTPDGGELLAPRPSHFNPTEKASSTN
jgi:hypothetical protein